MLSFGWRLCGVNFERAFGAVYVDLDVTHRLEVALDGASLPHSWGAVLLRTRENMGYWRSRADARYLI